MANAPVYKADDRSLMLPYYKRWLVEPTLRFIPASVHPNSITHAGHLLNLLAVGLLIAAHPSRGWMFFASMVLLQLYCWADNADGAHARRTRQSSAFGEFLDHGLDILNTTYIGLITIYTLGSDPGYAVALAILIPGAAATTVWEQTETGVFRMGLLNQIESVMVLSGTMIVSGLYGTQVWRSIHLGPLTAYDFLHVWPIVTISFGMLRSMIRVHQAGRPLSPEFAFLMIHGLILAAGVSGAASPVVAVAFAVAVNTFYGMRMLSLRLQGGRPRVEGLFLVGSIALGAFLAGTAAGYALDSTLGAALAVAACVVYGVFSLREARDGVSSLERIEASR
ncbi:MAG: CDP-alcohol phosphatidyltransferase family protein [Polyangiales bacterium]